MRRIFWLEKGAATAKQLMAAAKRIPATIVRKDNVGQVANNLMKNMPGLNSAEALRMVSSSKVQPQGVPRRAFQQFLNDYGHASPSVLLREHNMLTTMKGARGKGVRHIAKAVRSIPSPGSSVVAGSERERINKLIQDMGLRDFDYGKSARLPRNLINRLEENYALNYGDRIARVGKRPEILLPQWASKGSLGAAARIHEQAETRALPSKVMHRIGRRRAQRYPNTLEGQTRRRIDEALNTMSRNLQNLRL